MTRDRLLDTTAELLGRHGYQGTGVNAVLAASGAPNGSLYHHFPEGKDQLVAAAIERIGEQTSELLALAFERGPEAALELIFDRLATRLERDGFESGCRVATPLADGGADVVVVREAAARVFAAWTDAITDALVARGWKTIAARATAASVICLFEGALLLGKAEQSTQALTIARDAALTLLAARSPDTRQAGARRACVPAPRLSGSRPRSRRST